MNVAEDEAVQPGLELAAPDHDRKAVSREPLDTTEEDNSLSAQTVTNVFLGGLLLLTCLTACYFAAPLVLPIVVAFVLMLVFQPVMRVLSRWHIPRGVAAFLIILVFFGALAGTAAMLAAPAANWAQKLPSGIPKLQERLSFLSEPIAALQGLINRAERLTAQLTNQSSPLPVTLAGASLSDRLFEGTRYVVSGLLETILVLFFLLMAGDTFLRRLVEVLPSFRNKRQAVEIAQQIESDIAVYLVTITLMNAGVGIATGAVAGICGLGDPLLWGAVAFLLNFIPILGPLIGVVVFFLAGLLVIEPLWLAFAPAALYLGIHIAEGETITPLLLAHRFTINPVLVVIALVFWYWMWGVPGAILATPMLAIIKIVCDRIETLQPFGHFIEG